MSENENNIPEAALEEEDAFEVKKVRLAKLAAMREAGKDPYTVTKFARDCTAAAIKDEFDRLENTEVRIAGRIMSRRDMGKANFIDIADGSGRIQVYLRVNDIGESLEMPTANVTRAVDRLAQRGWVKRMGSERDRKAVFVVPTEDGEFQERIISEKSNELAEELLWSKLTPADQEAIGDVGSVVIDGLRRRRAEERNVGFADLRPID